MQKALRKIIADLQDLDASLEPFIVEVVERKYKSLTDGEMEVILKICEGLSSREIGLALFKGTRTVTSDRNSILRKLNCKTTAQAVALLFKAKILK